MTTGRTRRAVDALGAQGGSHASRARLRRALIATLLLLAAGPPATAVAYDDAGYLAYADRMQERLDPLWDEGSGQCRPGPAASTR